MLNKVVIAGRIAKPLELKVTQNGVSVCSFDLPVDRDFKNQNGEKETDWIPVTVWRNDAEYLTKYGEKGRMVIVEGRLQVRKWTDKNGQNRSTTEIKADKVYFADSNKSNGSGNSTAPTHQETSERASYESSGGFDEIEDDGQLPF